MRPHVPEGDQLEIEERFFLDVLGEMTERFEEAGIEHGLMGGVGSAVHGRPRWTHDIDVFLRAEDAARALTALEAAGFRTEETNPHWIYKAFKHGVLVDLIFRAKGDIYFDQRMAARVVRATFKGVPVRVLPREDLIIIKAIIHDEDTPRHWYDSLAMIAAGDIDWDYLIERASAGARRVLSLLAYAQSCDIVVPSSAIQKLITMAYPI